MQKVSDNLQRLDGGFKQIGSLTPTEKNDPYDRLNTSNVRLSHRIPNRRLNGQTVRDEIVHKPHSTLRMASMFEKGSIRAQKLAGFSLFDD